MGNYREFMTKGECLVSALLWTLNPILTLALTAYVLVFYVPIFLDWRDLWPLALLILLQLTSCAFHWHRYLAYNQENITIRKELKHTFAMAVAWTFSATLSIAVTLYQDTSPLQITLAVLLTFAAIIWWITYAKKRQEAGHEEKESS